MIRASRYCCFGEQCICHGGAPKRIRGSGGTVDADRPAETRGVLGVLATAHHLERQYHREIRRHERALVHCFRHLLK
eukprot:4496124-Prymnesium_polylepis.2